MPEAACSLLVFWAAITADIGEGFHSMKRTKWQWEIIALACLGMIVPTPLAAATVEGQARTATDVQLRDGGVLWGQVVDANGAARPETPVVLQQAGRTIATTMTDPGGNFSVEGLRGGTYEIVAAEACGLYRVWAPATAPPNAQGGALLVAGGEPLRGQAGPIGFWLSNPWVLTGIVAVAVALPIAIHQNRVHRTASP